MGPLGINHVMHTLGCTWSKEINEVDEPANAVFPKPCVYDVEQTVFLSYFKELSLQPTMLE
jgi:hypothetical protein